MEERRLELEPAVNVGGWVLIPIAWTVGRPVLRRRSLSAAMCREAFGVVVRDQAELRVLLCDGRVMSLDELATDYPSLREALERLR